MESYLRNMIDMMIAGSECPSRDLSDIKHSVPRHIVTKHRNEVILKLFLEKGDTAYARDGYHNAINLIEKHLIFK